MTREDAEIFPDRKYITRSRKRLPIKDRSGINHMKGKLRAKIKGECSLVVASNRSSLLYLLPSLNPKPCGHATKTVYSAALERRINEYNRIRVRKRERERTGLHIHASK